MPYGNSLRRKGLQNQRPITRSMGITARVTEDFHTRFKDKAEEVPGRTAAELAREVLEHYLTRAPLEQRVMEELWALRYIVLNGLPALNTAARFDFAAYINNIRIEADQNKADKARAILSGVTL